MCHREKWFPLYIIKINREIENQRKPQKPRSELKFIMIFNYFTKKRKLFYGRYAPSGIRVWRKLKKYDEFGKRPLF